MEEMNVSIKQEVGSISLNFEEMKQYLEGRLEEYRGAVFTDDSIKMAKACVAQLRKEQTALKTRITEVKKDYMKPFDEFKEKADELVKLYDTPIQFINEQVVDFEERRKSAKREAIKKIFEEYAADVKEYISLEKIYSSKWENATFKEKDIIEEITGVVESVKEAVATITGMNSEATQEALNLYKTNLSLTGAITYINNYEQQKIAILQKENERKRQEEIDRIREEERKKLLEEQEQKLKQERMIEEAKEEGRQEVIEDLSTEIESDTKEYIYKVTLGVKSKESFEMYMDSVGIDYEVLE